MSIYRQFLFELRYIPHILHLVTDFKQKSSRQFRSTAYLVFSTPAEARTLDTLIKSQVLYQLSYGCIRLLCLKKKRGCPLFVHPQGLEPWTP